MKHLLSTLLILALALLCVLCVYQWTRETRLRENVETLNLTEQTKSKTVASLKGFVQKLDDEVSKLLTQSTELQASLKKTEQELGALRRDFSKSESENEILKTSLETFKKALEDRNKRILEQQDKYKELMTERNEFVGKHNEVVGKLNEVTKKYNTLVDEFVKVRDQLVASQNLNQQLQQQQKPAK